MGEGRTMQEQLSRATHGAVAEGIGLPDGQDWPESVGGEGGFLEVAAEFSKISGGRGL